MKFSKELMKQIVLLIAITIIMILIVIHSPTIVSGIAKCIGIISPFLIGGAIAFILNIPMTAIECKLLYKWDGTKAEKFKRPTSMVMVLIIFLGVIGIFLAIIVPNLATTFTEISKQFPVFVNKILKLLANHGFIEQGTINSVIDSLNINFSGFSSKIVSFLQSGATQVVGSTVSIFSSVITTIVNAAIAFVFALYSLAQKETLERHFKKLLRAYVPEKYGQKIIMVCSLLRKNFASFITGQCLDALILGVLFVIVLFIFRMPYALMIGTTIAFTALIPLVGAFIGCTVAVILTLMVSPIKVLYFLIIFIVLQQIEGNLINPRIVGSSLGLPAIWVLVAITAGGSLFGVLGMVVFIPLVSTCYSLLRHDVNKRIS